jgi:hypothetical protein
MKCSKQLSVKMPWGEHTVVFHDSNVGNSVEDGEHSDHSHESCREKKCGESLRSHQQRLAR